MRLRKSFSCEDCGTPTERMRNADDPLVCLDCGIARSVANARRLSAAADARYGVGVRPHGHGRLWLPRGGRPKPP